MTDEQEDEAREKALAVIGDAAAILQRHGVGPETTLESMLALAASGLAQAFGTETAVKRLRDVAASLERLRLDEQPNPARRH